jgi:hypothetical protein
MLNSPLIPVCGIPLTSPPLDSTSISLDFEAFELSPPVGLAMDSDLFEQLVSTYRRQRSLLAQLHDLNQERLRAVAYLASPTPHLALGLAHLESLKTKRHGVLTLLRANRRRAEQLLGRPIVAGKSS